MDRQRQVDMDQVMTVTLWLWSLWTGYGYRINLKKHWAEVFSDYRIRSSMY